MMKKLSLLLLLLAFTACKTMRIPGIYEPEQKVTKIEKKEEVKKPNDSKKSGFEVLMPNAVVEMEKNKAAQLGKRVLSACNNSQFKPFTEKEATAELRQKITPETLSKTCVQVNRGYGQFQDLKFKEAIRLHDSNETVYRFECIYEKKYYTKELQVYINDKQQATSIKTRKWEDGFTLR